MKKMLIALFALFIMSMAFAAVADNCGDYEYEVNADGTATITKYTGKANELDIASELDGHTVTSIGDSAFDWCSSLKKISIPISVASIGANPFKGCNNLTTITVSPDSKYLAVTDGVLFEKTDKRLVTYPYAFTSKTYVIPNGIKVIGDYAFCWCDSLTSITIPDSVTTIGDYAFHSCESLTSIIIPDSVTTIGDYAFYACKSLTSITIPESVAMIGDNAFYGCDSLTITVGRDSCAKQYCIDNGIRYTYPDALDWLNS